MDINTICVTGKLTDIGVNDTTGLYPVIEARLTVNNGMKNGDVMLSRFNVRSYGKKSMFISTLMEGTSVTIEGHLIEDNYFGKSKTYINIDKLKVIA